METQLPSANQSNPLDERKSRIVNIVLLALLPFIGFYFGVAYERVMNEADIQNLLWERSIVPTSLSLNAFDEADIRSDREQAYANEAQGFSFSYPVGWVIQPVTKLAAGTLVDVSLHRAEELELRRDPSFVGEGPVGLYVRVYENSDKLDAREWVQKNMTKFGSLVREGELPLDSTVVLSEESIAGKPGVSFEADGLYIAKVIVVVNGDRAFMIRGEDIQRPGEIQTAYKALLSSFTFTK